MAQSSSNRARVIGDYLVGRKIGSGSFSEVWYARHRVHNTEVAIKEIVTGGLDKKLEESLMSEIDILRNINHPNIIHLYDIIQEPGKMHLVLEYCKGGDLSKFIKKRKGRIAEATAKHFMRQLASGLKILHNNNLIHRDLKPQNLLLSTNDDSSVLKIADFGFARSLQPTNLAATLCGSPLYMAPEIMQLHMYDAKADLWSVGAILFQLVTGKTPFTGNSQIQLLQNIMRSTEVLFPSDIKDLSSDCVDLCQKLLRHKAVERLSFKEFFNHPFLSRKEPDEMSRSSQEDILPFAPDDNSSGCEGIPSHVERSLSRPKYVFKASSEMDISCRYSVRQKPESAVFGFWNHGPSEGNPIESTRLTDHGPSDSLESIDQGYVLVSGSPVDVSSSTSASKPSHLSSILGSSPLASTNFMKRIESLQTSASVIIELVNEKVEAGKQLEAFSIQFVILAIWKQALDICHTQRAVSSIEGSPTRDSMSPRESTNMDHASPAIRECLDSANTQCPQDICSHIEREFLLQVGNAEELAKVIEAGNMDIPDAMETIFQSALALGKNGAVDEYMGNTENAAVLYTKAVRLLVFLLVLGPTLVINPPFSLTNSDRYRLQTYINVLSNRQIHSSSQRMALLKCEEDQHCSP